MIIEIHPTVEQQFKYTYVVENILTGRFLTQYRDIASYSIQYKVIDCFWSTEQLHGNETRLTFAIHDQLSLISSSNPFEASFQRGMCIYRRTDNRVRVAGTDRVYYHYTLERMSLG